MDLAAGLDRFVDGRDDLEGLAALQAIDEGLLSLLDCLEDVPVELMMAEPVHVRRIRPVALQDPASSGVSSWNLQTVISFMANPPTSTEPFSPRIEMEPSRSTGRAAVVASITPSAPLAKRSRASPVSSASMDTRRVAAIALTDATSPIMYASMSTWCEAWLEKTPPSIAQVPRQGAWS
jgi:hypothetical protein